MLMDRIDMVMLKTCPFLAAGVLAGAVYWTAITYGAVTIMQVVKSVHIDDNGDSTVCFYISVEHFQVVGLEEGLQIMGQTHTLVLIVGLPAIPVMLIFGKMIRWEETALLVLRRYASKIPILKYILPSFM